MRPSFRTGLGFTLIGIATVLTAAAGARATQWGTLGGYALQARKVDPVAATLVVPYLGWVSFAGLLNSAVVRKNPKWLMAG
jgi:tryptophan-rich sensory protein